MCGGMLGFSDIQDLDFLSSREVAARMGFRSWASLGRALRRLGADLPPALLRGRHRGDILKAWFQTLPAGGPPIGAAGEDGDRNLDRHGDRQAARPESASGAPPAATVIALEARRQAALQRLRSA